MAASNKVEAAIEQLKELEEAAGWTVAYIRGRSTVSAKPRSNILSKLVCFQWKVVCTLGSI